MRYLIVLKPIKNFVLQDLEAKKFLTVFENISKFNIELVEIFHFNTKDQYIIHVIGEDEDIVQFIWFLFSEIPAYSGDKIELFELLGSPSCVGFKMYTLYDNRIKKRVFRRNDTNDIKKIKEKKNL